MWVIITVFIFLVALGVIVVSFVHWFQSPQSHHVVAQEEAKPFGGLSLSLAFDPEYAVLWDTQLPALKSIGGAGVKGVAMKHLRSCYIRDARRCPELYDGFSFRQWLHFLEMADLIAYTKGRVVLTSEGTDFLHSCLSTGLQALATKGPAH
jgi:hypothetical protein